MASLSWRRGLRAVLLGALLVVALCALSLHSNLRYGRYITAASLPNGATFVFVIVLALNAPFARRKMRLALTTPELALVFSMLFVSAALPQASIAETLVTLCVAPAFLPKGSPRVAAYEGQAPTWLLVRDTEAIRRFYEGWGPAGGPTPWAAWLVPLAGWSAFVLLLLVALYCLSRAFTHRWVREERVTFPLMELPLELLGAGQGAHEPGAIPLWRNKLTYVGAAIPALMIIVGQFHNYYPQLPAWEQIVSYKIGAAFVAPPWRALSDFTISIWPLVIGIAYLLNAEVAVSIWFFHLLFWTQLFVWSALGYQWQEGAGNTANGFNPLDWIHFAEFGGAIVLSTSLLLSVKTEVARAARALFGRESAAHETLPVPPWAVAGFALANFGMLVWGAFAGANVFAIGLFLLFLYAIVVALGRMVAAGGLYLVDNGFTPQPLMYGLAGVGAISKATHFVVTGQEALVGRADMSFLYFAINDSKVAHDTRTENRWHTLGVAVAVLAALASAYFFILLWSYRYGAVTFKAWPLTWNAPQMFDRTAGFMTALNRAPNPWTWAGVATGMVIALFLLTMNRKFLWWGLSPFGFVMASSWNISNQIWSSVFLGWMAASLVRRYGGLRVYRGLRPFFLGLILGDAVSVCLMALMESLIGVRAGAA